MAGGGDSLDADCELGDAVDLPTAGSQRLADQQRMGDGARASVLVSVATGK